MQQYDYLGTVEANMKKRAPDFQEPAPTYLPKEKINDLAERVSEKLGYAPETDLHEVIKDLGGKISYLDMREWYKTESGSIEVHAPNDFEVFLSQFTSPTRDTFTLAHELGHYILHSESGKKPIRVSRHGSNRLEWEANWFAAGFLMPAKRFRAAYKDGNDFEELAKLFQTSVDAAKVRAKTLGLES